MSKRILEFGKGLLGIFFFFAIQIGFQIVFYDIFVQKNFLVNNILLLIMEFVLMSILILMNRKKLKNDYADFNENHKKYLKYGFKLWFIGLIIMMISNVIIAGMTKGLASNEEANRQLMLQYPIYMVISTMMLAPFIEELTFRGNFKDAFKNKKVFILFTASVFASVHVLNGITSPLELLYYIPYGALSIAFGKIYMETDNIYTTMVIHSVHNSLSIILLVIAYLAG